jgi:hypothetical protein
MNQTDYTQLPLHDIHLPGVVAWWPPAPGWWLAAALVLAALAVAGFQYWRGRHRRAALAAVRRLQAALEQGAEPVGCLQRLSTLLRRYAMTTAEEPLDAAALDGPARDRVPGLIGERWLRYLDSRWQRDEFERGTGRLLLGAPYARPDSIERLHALELTTLCLAWLKHQQKRSRLALFRGPRFARRSGAPDAFDAFRGRRRQDGAAAAYRDVFTAAPEGVERGRRDASRDTERSGASRD